MNSPRQLKRKFVSVNELKFVNELKRYPLLFNPLDPEYKWVPGFQKSIESIGFQIPKLKLIGCFRNAGKRKDCWELISAVVGLSQEDCRKRWRSLRDGYIRNQKLPLEEARKWIHFDMINSFYEPFSDMGWVCGSPLQNKLQNTLKKPQSY